MSMEKRGRIEVGITPSEISGKTSETIKQGQAVTKEETPEKSSIEKAASMLD